MTQLAGKPKVDIASVALDLDVSDVRTYTGTVAAILGFSELSRLPGKDIEVFIPAGKSTGAPTFPGSWNATAAKLGYVLADDFDNTLDFLVRISTAGFSGTTIASATFEETLPADVTPPNVASVTGAVGSNLLEVAFDEPVIVESLVGLTLLPWTVGAARTLTSIVSGSGTDTVVFGMSGTLSSGDAFSFTAASSEITDLSNNSLVDSVTAAGFGGVPQAAAQQFYFSSAQQVSAMATQVDDFSGKGNHGTVENAVVNTADGFYFPGTSARILPGVNSPTGAFTFALRVSRETGAAWGSGFQCLISNASLSIHLNSSFLSTWIGGAGSAGSYGASGWVALDEHDIYITWDGTTATIYVDDLTTPVDTVSDSTIGTAAPLSIGTYDVATANGWTNNMQVMQFWDGVVLSESERVANQAAIS